MLAEVIAHRDGCCRHPIAAELVGEVGNIVQIELRTYEKTVRERDLEAGSEVELEMVSAAERGNLFRAYRGSDTSILRDGETSSRTANTALQLHDSPLCDERLIDAIHVNKGLSRPKWSVVLMNGLEVNFRSGAEMLAEHNISSEPQKEAAELGSCLAKGVGGVW